ncbi:MULTISPECIES: iron ABC transporter permease [Microbacterium]|uniref:ABC transporter permease n=1 Tax=Microbacterium TaxID=33882 RepID=UPI000DD15E60|nr:iron ABC transporter permease [Microbacterium sp. PM5]AXA95509.1 iron ABC transporter permease [Microbacterium sp. PM5]
MPLLVLALIAAAVLLIPVGFVVWVAVSEGWSQLSAQVFRPRVGELLANTAGLLVLAVPLCVVVGVGAAWTVERTTLPGRKAWAIALASPLAMPAFVSGYGWISAVPSLQGLGGGLLIAVGAYYPLVYLPALATLRRLDPSLEESARALGLGPLATFGRVVLPQLRVAILGGALVVALHLLAEYGAFALLRFDTFTTAIVSQFQSSFAGPAANALGVVLAALCLVLLVGEASARGRLRYARVGRGAARPAVPHRLGRAVIPVMAALSGILILAVCIPGASLLRWALRPEGWQSIHLLPALAQTLVLSGAGALAATVVALPCAWLSVRHPSRLARSIEGAMYLASSLPTIIVALALVTVTLRVVPGLYQTPATVIAAYVIVFLPRALVSLRSGLAQVPPRLEEAAQTLGRTRFAATVQVTAPLMASSFGAALALVGLGCANELTATLLLAPSGTRTLATQFWSETSNADFVAGAPYAIMLIVLSVPSVALLLADARRRSDR